MIPPIEELHVHRRPGVPQCEFVLCEREAELEVVVPTEAGGIAPLLVCGLHVTPVLTWGVAELVDDPIIRYLSGRPESAA